MKKLSIIFIAICLIFVSCNNGANTESEQPAPSNSIPRSQWDADNIAYTNTGIHPDSSNRWYYTRQSGNSGIIGTFENATTQYTNNGSSYTHRYTYYFYETGYFKQVETGFSVSGSYFKDTDIGTFIIGKYNNDCFSLQLTKDNGDVNNFYYVVDQNGLTINSAPYSN